MGTFKSAKSSVAPLDRSLEDAFCLADLGRSKIKSNEQGSVQSGIRQTLEWQEKVFFGLKRTRHKKIVKRTFYRKKSNFAVAQFFARVQNVMSLKCFSISFFQSSKIKIFAHIFIILHE